MGVKAIVQRLVLAAEKRLALGSREIPDAFHELYYSAGSYGATWQDTRWMGVPVFKCPMDLWMYQEILHEIRPSLIIETGTLYGGSALYLATLCDALDHGRIVSVDIAPRGQPEHPRVRYVTGSSTDPDVIGDVWGEATTGDTVLVILDSDHSRDHVLAECRAYAALVTRGSYLIVEDTNLNGHPVHPTHGPGPMEAVEAFMKEQRDFQRDATRERLLLTFNPRGYLRRHR